MADSEPRLGLCLSGGGVTGAMYQVGCLAALEDRIEGVSATDFDVFVGTASGATVAMALAGGLSVQRMYRALLDPADDFFPLTRNQLLRIDMGELLRVFGSAISAARRVVSSAATSPLDVKVWDELERFVDSLPAGLFSLDPYERFLQDFMARRGIAQRFEDLQKPLFVIANDLDAGRRTVFGKGELSNVPVARAVAAACAIPILYAPVEIGGRDYVDGGMGDAAHVDVAEEEGCRLILVINPMVPVHAGAEGRDVPTGHGKKSRVRDKGAIWVYNQAMRMRMEARFSLGLDRFRIEHPDTRVAVLEPKQSDATLFMYSPMNFAARRAILQEGYTSTARILSDPESSLRKTLEGAGLKVVS
ncbi:MAG: patatin-like phospholipase family protein [Myxococcales bacterium]|nr:patatin-like phospholipase family protein [Myxococcales bacterium]